MFDHAMLNGEIEDFFNFPLFNYPESCGPEIVALEEDKKTLGSSAQRLKVEIEHLEAEKET